MKTLAAYVGGVISALAVAAGAGSVDPDHVRQAAALSIENQGEMLSRARWSTNTITVTWARSTAHARKLCSDAGVPQAAQACAHGPAGHCTVIAVQPQSFYDIRALAIFGHEVWHCFGATHD